MKAQQVQRLQGLSAWLRKFGHTVTTLRVPMSDPSMEQRQASSGILDALAAAGRPGIGMRLQQLQLVATGGKHPPAVCAAFSVCPQLRQLELDFSCGGSNATPTPGQLWELCAAVQQLTQLTSLTLSVHHVSNKIKAVDDMFVDLPGSLMELKLEKLHKGCLESGRLEFEVCASSLGHLSALQRLALPRTLRITTSSHNPLAAFTALTHVRYPQALSRFGDTLLLAPPNLVEVLGGCAEHSNLSALATKTALRSLSCFLYGHYGEPPAPALAQLTQLTKLDVRFHWFPLQHPPEYRLAQVAALSTLVGLRSLTVPLLAAPAINLAVLTALTHLTIKASYDDYSGVCCRPEDISLVVQPLPSVRGRIREVAVLGVSEWQQEQWHSAVAGAVGEVQLEVRQRFDGCDLHMVCMLA